MKLITKGAYTEILFMVVLLLLFIKFGILPSKEKLETKKRTLSELQEAYEVKKKSLLIGEVKAEASELNYQKQIREDFSSYLYSRDKDPLLVQLQLSKKIPELAGNSTLRIESIELLPLNQGNYTIEVPLNVKISGKTKEVISFLENLERFFISEEKKICKLREVSLKEKNRELQLTLQISVLVSGI